MCYLFEVQRDIQVIIKPQVIKVKHHEAGQQETRTYLLEMKPRTTGLTT